ncbi:Di-copper centre-containing protein [Pholiota conissans]|uniref:Di-copper centre-containing protein n=1 Tax=Pholiota conissans TaxID=109636 RepID=A0A9P5Z365_9AGAR|nr:Di-copper centre-containing protein [Pholiota conissans]
MAPAFTLVLALFTLVNVAVGTPLALAQNITAVTKTNIAVASSPSPSLSSPSSSASVQKKVTVLTKLAAAPPPSAVPVQKKVTVATNPAVVVSPSPSPSTSLFKVPAQRKQCEKLVERREWRTLSREEKASYIDAIKCLQSRPAVKPVIKAARSRYDEFQAFHINQADAVHVAGEFLPWHRQYVKNYEAELHKCGYKGGNPYWDWTLDTHSDQTFAKSPIFDPETGFGGDGQLFTYKLPAPVPPAAMRIDPVAFRGCVMDGPFANHTIPLGPGKYIGDHCLTRGIKEEAKEFLNTPMVDYIMTQTNFGDFRIQVEGLPITPGHRVHDGGHYGVGGEMSNFYSSPGDPLFYLHHSNLDRMWWNWQQMKPERLYEITGRSATVPPFKNVTLDYPLIMSTLGPSAVIGDVMDIHSEPNCYTYI